MDPSTHLIWITSRAAGVTAVLLAGASVALGLLMSGSRRRGTDWRVAHEALALGTLAAIGLHAVTLLADPWLKPGVAGVLAPFQIGYRPVAVAAGIVAAYGLVALGLGYYARRRIGPARWRRLHRWTALFWVLAVVHGFTAGSDAGQPWFIAAVGMVTIPAALLLVTRLASRASSSGAGAAPAARSAPPLRPQSL